MKVDEKCMTDQATAGSGTIWLRLMSTIAAGALVATLVAEPTVATAQSGGFGGSGGFVIVGGGTQGKNAALLKDDGKCVASPELAAAWIQKNLPMQKLREAFEKADAAWDNLPALDFYYGADSSPKGEQYRRAAKNQIKAHYDQLKVLAMKHASLQRKSCETCYRFDAWAQIVKIAAFETDAATWGGKAVENLVGRKKIKLPDTSEVWIAQNFIGLKDLTSEQVEDADVVKMVKKYMALHNFKTPTAYILQDDAACAVNMFKENPDADNAPIPTTEGCTENAYQQGKAWLAQELVKALDSAGKKYSGGTKMMSILKESKSGYMGQSCPSQLFPDNWLLGPYDK